MSKKFYSLLLLLYPESHRTRFGAEMLQVFDDAERAAATNGRLLGFWVRIISDAFVSAALERIAALQTKHSTMNSFLKPTIGKVVLAAIGAVPLFWVVLLAFIRFSLLLPHPHVSGIGVMLAFSFLVFAPMVVSAAISYGCSCALAAMLASPRSV